MRSSGSRSSAAAMLVSGPSVTRSCRPGSAAAMSSSAATASSDVAARDGSGRSAPPMPSWPWTNWAVSSGRASGRSRPAWSGISAPPARSSVTTALRTARSSGTLPATTVTARTSTDGSLTASTRAMASSDAVSVSITMLRRGIPAVWPPARPHPEIRCPSCARRDVRSEFRVGGRIPGGQATGWVGGS